MALPRAPGRPSLDAHPRPAGHGLPVQNDAGFLEKGDIDRPAVWKQVPEAIKEFCREGPREGETVN